MVDKNLFYGLGLGYLAARGWNTGRRNPEGENVQVEKLKWWWPQRETWISPTIGTYGKDSEIPERSIRLREDQLKKATEKYEELHSQARGQEGCPKSRNPKEKSLTQTEVDRKVKKRLEDELVKRGKKRRGAIERFSEITRQRKKNSYDRKAPLLKSGSNDYTPICPMNTRR